MFWVLPPGATEIRKPYLAATRQNYFRSIRSPATDPFMPQSTIWMQKSSGQACKPDSPDISFLSISYTESMHSICHLRQQCHARQDSLHVFCTFSLAGI